MEQEKKYIITESLINGLLDYLMTRPCGEVFGGVQGLQNLEEIKEEKSEG